MDRTRSLETGRRIHSTKTYRKQRGGHNRSRFNIVANWNGADSRALHGTIWRDWYIGISFSTLFLEYLLLWRNYGRTIRNRLSHSLWIADEAYSKSGRFRFERSEKQLPDGSSPGGVEEGWEEKGSKKRSLSRLYSLSGQTERESTAKGETEGQGKTLFITHALSSLLLVREHCERRDGRRKGKILNKSSFWHPIWSVPYVRSGALLLFPNERRMGWERSSLFGRGVLLELWNRLGYCSRCWYSYCFLMRYRYRRSVTQSPLG